MWTPPIGEIHEKGKEKADKIRHFRGGGGGCAHFKKIGG